MRSSSPNRPAIAFHAIPLFARDLQQGRILARNLGHGGIAQKAHHLPREMSGAVPLADEMVDLPQHVFAGAARDRLHHFFENMRGRGSDQIAYRVSRKPSAGRCNRLIENRQRIAHGPVAGFGKQRESIVIGFNIFAANEIAQLRHNRIELYGAKAEVLAARANRLRNVLRLRGCEHKDDMIRRLFQRLQQCVEGCVGNLVRFVENVNLEAVACGPVARSFAQFADFVDTAIRRRVDFDYVNCITGSNLGAGFTDAARLRHWLIGRPAIQCGRENARHGGFSDPAMAAEYVAMRGAPLLQSILQSAGNVLLSDNFGEFLRTIFARQDGVAHELEESIIRDRRQDGRAAISLEGLLKTKSKAYSSASILARRFCRRDGWPRRKGGYAMQLKLATKTKDGILIVDCTGRIVFGEESSLIRETVKRAISENNRIVLNLGEVSYIDSGGLGTLVALRTTAQNAGGTIKLTNLTKRVGDLLQVTKLLTVFDVYNSEAEAIESFRKAA